METFDQQLFATTKTIDSNDRFRILCCWKEQRTIDFRDLVSLKEQFESERIKCVFDYLKNEKKSVRFLRPSVKSVDFFP